LADGPPAAVLAIDGGNSKTDLALVAPDGTVLAALRGPGASHQDHGVEPAARILDSLVRTLAAQAGLESGTVASHTSACLAGADLPEEEEQLTAALRACGWSRTAVAVNDTFAVLRAGADQPWGVAVVCGAGINCLAVGPDGRTARYLALGTLTGDWGGGMGLWQEVMWHAMRAEDGRGPSTGLAPAVAAHFGLPTVSDVAIAVHKGKLGEEDLLRLTAVLFTVAATGDPVARHLVERQAEEICVMAVTAMRRAGLPSAGTPVVLGGGLLEARDTLLTGAVEERLAAAAPGAVPRVVDIPPIAGAGLLGLDYLGAGPAAARRLRDCYRTGLPYRAAAAREVVPATRPGGCPRRPRGCRPGLTGRRVRSLRRTAPRRRPSHPPHASGTATGAKWPGD
jgi:N-acetylglucosamine kinase-like BadF-type ATPase